MSVVAAGPLAGCRVLVTRASEQAEGLLQLLGQAGAVPLELPTISSKLLDVANRLQDVSGYSWAVFTSPNGVRAVADGARRWPRLAAVGTATATALERAGLAVAFRPSEARGAVLGEELPIEPGERVLLLRSDIARPELPGALRRRGALVDEVAVYRTLPRSEPAPEIRRALEDAEIDAIVLTSPSSARGLVAACGSEPAVYARARIVAIGPTTAEAVRELGLGVATEAAEPSDAGLVEALAGLWRER